MLLGSRALLGRLEYEADDTAVITENAAAPTDRTEGLRIAAVFIILSAGLLGGVPPLFIKALRNQDSLPTFLIRAFSAGVILALALVHILPDAIEELVNLGGIDYPLGGTCVLVGLFIMIFIEHGAHLMHDGGHTHAHAHAPPGGQGQGHAHAHGRGGGGPGHLDHDRSSHRHSHMHRKGAGGGAGCNGAGGASAGEPLLLPAETAECLREEEVEEEGRDAAGGDVGAPDVKVSEADAAVCPSHVHAHAGRPEPSGGGHRHHHHHHHHHHHLTQQQQQQPQQQPQQQEELNGKQQNEEPEQQQGRQQEQEQEQEQRQQAPLRRAAAACDKAPKCTTTAAAAVLTGGGCDGEGGGGGGAGGGGVFKRRSAGPALVQSVADAPPPLLPLPLPRSLAASSMPLLAHHGNSSSNNNNNSSSSSSNNNNDGVAAEQRGLAVLRAGDTGAAVSAAATAAPLHCPSETHCHDCVSRASAPNWASAVEASAEGSSSLRLRIVAYLFELGCIFHSFIIGLSLGVNRTSLSQVRALLLALSFHQALEGLSLASVINGGGFSIGKAAAMVATYSITCPLGVAIGIAIAASYEPESTRARAAQGCLNGVSGGMLLYISLVQLVAEDMGKYLLGPPPAVGSDAMDEDGGGGSAAASATTHGSGVPCGHGHGRGGGGIGCRIRLPSFLAFCLGAASMCLLAVWA